MKAIIHSITGKTNIPVNNIKRVHGGDINETYCVYSGDKKYFLKVNEAARYPLLFEKEANGLAALKKNTHFIVPGVIHFDIAGNYQYLLMEWMEPGQPGNKFWEEFGRSLAHMHRQTRDFFGWEVDNYIGSITQKNNQQKKWSAFYSEYRILPLIKRGFDENIFDKKIMQNGELFCRKASDLFPEEPPALLHGDLWSGNFMIHSIGKPALFDPAVYTGHREMDMGMMQLFGGFHQRLFDSYHEYYPLETQWQQRLQLTQLYPLLMHALLFGGHYTHRCRDILSYFSQ